MKEPQFPFDVFLSHNSKDKPQVRRLAERLRAAGLRVWFDEWIIQPGDDIYLAIEHGLEASRCLVLCLSPAALGSWGSMRSHCAAWALNIFGVIRFAIASTRAWERAE